MFHQRLLSTVVMWGVVLAAVFVAPPFCSWGLLALLGSLALWECYRIFEKANLRVMKGWGSFAGLALMAGSWFFYKHGASTESVKWLAREATVLSFESTVLGVAMLVMFLRLMAQKQQATPITTLAATMFGIIYVSWLFNFVIKIHFIAPASSHLGTWQVFDGKYAVIYLVLVTKMSDAGAYVIGSMIGRHKLIPHISPKKTWEGTLGAVVVAALAGLGAFYLFRESLGRLHMTALHATLAGALLGVVGIIGDLSESLIKREAGVKDSGHWLPGIGGMLDLIDSLLFTAPALYAYLRLFLRVG